MPIENFHPEEFAKNMAQQAMQVIPPDLSQTQGEYIINKVYQFATLAGDALNQDPNISLTLEQAQLITQFIAEWTFHKGIDTIRAKIAEENWDQVLQQIAFAIFQECKDAMAAKIELNQLVKIVEDKVTHSYESTIKELVGSGSIREEAVQEILSQSNLDIMAKNTYAPDESISDDIRAKHLKYASVAILLKSVSPEHREQILNIIDKEEQIKSCMQDKQLEEKVNAQQLKDCLQEIKEVVVAKKNETLPVIYFAMIKELLEEFSEKEIYNLVRYERKKINNFVSFAIEDEPTKDMLVKFSPHLAKVIYNYLKAKLNASA